MNTHHSRATTVAILLTALLLSTATACGQAPVSNEEHTRVPETSRPAVTQGQEPTDTCEPPTEGDSHVTLPEAPPDGATAEELRTYYEALVAHLKATLLDERADRFADEFAFQNRIKELEATVSRLETLLKDVPTSGTPEESIPADTAGGSADTEPETAGGNSQPEAGNSGDNNQGVASHFRYTVENGRVTLYQYVGSSRHVVIPSYIDGCPVTRIGDSTFKNTDVTSVVIPSTVTSVGWFAFYGCHGLASVTIPASVVLIEYAAFDGCPSVILHCPAGSYAEKYAASFGIQHHTA